MNRYILSSVFAGLLVSVNLAASEMQHWGYAGAEGPDHWGELSPDYASCSNGLNQSPIDLTGMVDANLPEISIRYTTSGEVVVNNGHTIKVEYQPGSEISVNGQTFELKQFHFHSPSENTVEGESFPMEAHFVHADKDGNLAVIAVMYKLGEQNAELAKAWAGMPQKAGDKAKLSSAVNADALLPKERGYYRFNGSLTTPPCTEGVQWYVMKTVESLSQEQLDQFVKVMKHDNNRPVQPINARVVIE